ncbi:MAG: crotonase/enoyl-CoA hydratase family protein [Gammaproteobacteria bacterium]|nr:crotonase/enoyl-CoA hydratase family protein [Gammaproteobacteria bacterium]
MTTLVHYSLADGIATLTLDDGKRNALSPAMFRDIYAALDRAEADRAIVILTGREQVFSAGFDLKVMKAGGLDTLRMLRAGYSLTARVLAYPYPVITACNGHVLAMGVFLMLSTDYAIGTRGDFRVAANEVAIGMTMPRVAAAMLRHRLAPADYQAAVTLSQYFPVEEALRAGFFHELTEAPQLMQRARELAAGFAKLDRASHTASKRRIRGPLIRYIRRSVPLDLVDAAWAAIWAARRGKG